MKLIKTEAVRQNSDSLGQKTSQNIEIMTLIGQKYIRQSLGADAGGQQATKYQNRTSECW